MQHIRLALRDWDHLTPLLMGEVDLSSLHETGHTLDITRVASLPPLDDQRFDAAEISLSGYSRAVADGSAPRVALPHVVMQSFRHRCIIVAADSPLQRPEQLAGRRIGLTGWPDSGNTWTRAVLAEYGVGIDQATWVVGRLTGEHPVTDRLSGFGRPGHIIARDDKPLVDQLSDGELDAVLTPFMPHGFYSARSPWRPLFADLRWEESAYFGKHGYVPGMHLLGVSPELAHSPAAEPLVAALCSSRQIWTDRRRKYGDTSLWLTEDLRHEAAVLPNDWWHPGLPRHAPMIQDFLDQQVAQELLPTAPTLQQLFPTEAVVAAATGGPATDGKKQSGSRQDLRTQHLTQTDLSPFSASQSSKEIR